MPHPRAHLWLLQLFQLIALAFTRRALLLAAAVLLAAGCAGNSFQGISLAPGAAKPELQSLATRARGGDKHAQLELGIRFEEGHGVPMDWDRAERLYRMAATRSGGTTMIYVPPVRRGGAGHVMPVSNGPVVPGLAEARLRLEALRKRRATEGAPRRI
ncbi:MAG TPA: SEL1-like repeat protein [Allosphingosinicella sp.]